VIAPAGVSPPNGKRRFVANSIVGDVAAGTANAIVQRIRGIRGRRHGPPPGVPTTGLKFLLDEAQGTAVSLQFYATAEDMAAGAATLNAMVAGETPGTRVSVDACEIKLERDFA
jgi:hypothetical protein